MRTDRLLELIDCFVLIINSISSATVGAVKIDKVPDQLIYSTADSSINPNSLAWDLLLFTLPSMSGACPLESFSKYF